METQFQTGTAPLFSMLAASPPFSLSLSRMLPQSLTFILLLLLLLSILPTHSSPSIYTALLSNGLPMGILPKGINNFTLNDDGSFQVYLDHECNSKFENEIHYDTYVSGVLTYGRIGAVNGISAQDLFLWLRVKEIRVDVPSRGVIYFDTSVVSKQFSLSLFENPKECTPGGLLGSGMVEKEHPHKLRHGFDKANFGRAIS